MAKLVGPIKITGKVKSSGVTFVDRSSGIYMRALPAVATEKSEDFNAQSANTGSVSILAGQINRIFKKYARRNTQVRMYARLLSQLKSVQPAKRLFRLHSLKKLDVHHLKTMERIDLDASVVVTKEGHRLAAAVDYARHPKMEKNDHFYRLEVIVAWWLAESEEPESTEQHSKWIEPGDSIKGYDFMFELPDNCLDWIMMFRCRLAERKNIKGFPPTDIVQIIDAGSFDEAAVAELEAYYEAKRNEPKPILRSNEEDDDGVEGRERR